MPSSLSNKSSLRSSSGSSSLGSSLRSSLPKPSSSSSVLQTSLVIGGGTPAPAPAAPAPAPAPAPPTPPAQAPPPTPPPPKEEEEDHDETNAPPPTMHMDDLADALPSSEPETTTSHPQYAPPTVNPTMKQRFEEIPNENIGEEGGGTMSTTTTGPPPPPSQQQQQQQQQHSQYDAHNNSNNARPSFAFHKQQRWEEVPTDLHHAYTFEQEGGGGAERPQTQGGGGPIRSKMNFVDSEEPDDYNQQHPPRIHYPGGPGGGGGSSKQRWEEVPTDLHHAYTMGGDHQGPVRSKMNFVDSEEVPDSYHPHGGGRGGGGGSGGHHPQGRDPNASKQRWEEVPTDLHHAYTMGDNKEPVRSKMNYKQSEEMDSDRPYHHPSSNSRPMGDEYSGHHHGSGGHSGGGGTYASSSNAGGASKQRWEEVPTDLHHAYTMSDNKEPVRSKMNYKETDDNDFDENAQIGHHGHGRGRGGSSSLQQQQHQQGGGSSSLKQRWEEIPTDLHHAYTMGDNKEAVQSKMNYVDSTEDPESAPQSSLRGGMMSRGGGHGGHGYRGPPDTKQRWEEVPTDLHHAYTFRNNNEAPGKVGAHTLSQYVVDSEESPSHTNHHQHHRGGSSLKQRWEAVPTDLHHRYTISGGGQQPQQHQGGGGHPNHGVQDAAMQQQLQDEYDDRILERMEGVEDHGTKSPLVVIDGANIAYAYADAKYAMQSVESSLQSSGKGRREPDSKGIEVAADYFLESGTRVLVVIPAPWFRAKPRPGDTSNDNAMMMTPQLEILNTLKSKGLLVASPPTDDDDAYAIMIARREDSRSKKRVSGDSGGGFVLSNDMFRDAVHRDGMELKEWLKAGTGNGPGRISFAFCDMGSKDDYGDNIMDFVPNPVHPLIDYIETENRKS
mmetsp:Transcript_23776/g.36747  ORF Transcript_23776/g.36747 Transcript_23776/m.36747 type:complete len:888 (+) Transcript_23776:123-2786(+)